MKAAEPVDSERLWQWVNDPETRAASFGAGPRSRADHDAWFTAQIADPTARINESAVENRERPIRILGQHVFYIAEAYLKASGIGDAPRLAVTYQYCEGWLRQQENFFLAIPPAIAAGFSPRLQELLGYSIWPPFMGMVTAHHPARDIVSQVEVRGDQ